MLDSSGDFLGEARLADAAGTKQRDDSQIVAIEEAQDLSDPIVAPKYRGKASRNCRTARARHDRQGRGRLRSG